MNIFILNKNFENILLVESYQSFIWTDRYDEAGDFELYLPASSYDKKYFEVGYYVCSSSSDRLMIINKIVCETGDIDGDFLTISGKSLESILERRVLQEPLDISGGLQDAVEQVLNENVISPSNEKRKIGNVVFVKNFDEKVTSVTVESQFEAGESVYDVISTLMNYKRIGMRMRKNTQNQFLFELYSGVNRSYSQRTNPWVVFSPDFDNLISSTYTESDTNYKNQVTVSGTYDIDTRDAENNEEVTDEEIERTKEIIVMIGDENSGLDRFEYYVKASDVVSRLYDEENNETYLSEEEFQTRLLSKGEEELNKYDKESDFDTEVDHNHTFKMNKDYFLGDVLQVSNQYGISRSLRVKEYIISVSASGIEHYPSFSKSE